MKLLILLHHRFELWNAPDWFPKKLNADFPQVEVVHRADYGELEREIKDAEVFVGWSLREEQLRAARKLRWIHSPAAAVHQLMSPELIASEIVVTNARQVHGPVVAEHAIALMLALAKRLPSAVRYQRKHVWAQEALWREQPRPRELAGSTLCLVGLGSIGRNVAERALALGMRVVALREHPEKGMGAAAPAQEFAVRSASELDDILPEAHFLVLAVPLTPRTHGLINAARLAKMRGDAYLVNVSRGPLIDEPALLRALQQRTIAGAAVDVFSAEPLPSDSPFWNLDNLLITPHSAAVTERLWERHYSLLAENLRRFLAGEPLLGVVDKHAGY